MASPLLVQAVAYARVDGATGVASTARNCVTAQTGVGDYTIDLSYPCDEEGCILLFESETLAIDDTIVVTHTTDIQKQIETFTAGAPANCDFAVVVLKCV